MRFGRIILAAALLLGVGLASSAQAADPDAQAHRLGADAAQAARVDPANAESAVAARYREALALGTDDAARARIRAAFQRGYQDALAAPTFPAPPAARVYDVTVARDVAWGQPVGPSRVFTPDVNPLYVWFHHQGIAPGTTIGAVWYFLGTATPTKIGEGSVNVTPPADWAQFTYELAAGKRWPAGEYGVEILVGGQRLAEARFQVAASAPPTATPGATPSIAPAAGRWTIQYPMWSGTAPHALELTQDGARLTGTMRTPRGSTVRVEGAVASSEATLTFIYDDVAALAELMPREVAQQALGVSSRAEMTLGSDPRQLTGMLSIFSLTWAGSPPVLQRRLEGGTAAAKTIHAPKPIVMRHESGATLAAAPAPATAAPTGGGPRHTHPTLGFTITVPAGWAVDPSAPGDQLILRPRGSDGLLDVYTRPLQRGDDVLSTALGWEGKTLRPGSGTNLHTKLGGRETVVDGSRAYEALYRGDDIMAKAVYIGKGERVFVIVSMFRGGEFPQRVPEIDQVVASFTTGSPGVMASPPSPPAPPPAPDPVSDFLEGLGRVLRGR